MTKYSTKKSLSQEPVLTFANLDVIPESGIDVGTIAWITSEGAFYILKSSAGVWKRIYENSYYAGTPSYVLVKNPIGGAVDEGDSMTVNISANVADGASVDYTWSGISTSDITGGALTGNAIIYNGIASITLVLAEDLETEGIESATFTLAANDSFGNSTNSVSTTFTIADTSRAATIDKVPYDTAHPFDLGVSYEETTDVIGNNVGLQFDHIFFNNTGTKFFGLTGGVIYMWNLDSAYKLTDNIDSPADASFNSGVSAVWAYVTAAGNELILGTSNTLRRYSLLGGNLSQASLSTTLSYPGNRSNVNHVWYDGTNMVILSPQGASGARFDYYTFDTDDDVSSQAALVNTAFENNIGNMGSIYWAHHGKIMTILNDTDGKIDEYRTVASFDLSTSGDATFSPSAKRQTAPLSTTGISNTPLCHTFDSTGENLYWCCLESNGSGGVKSTIRKVPLVSLGVSLNFDTSFNSELSGSNLVKKTTTGADALTNRASLDAEVSINGWMATTPSSSTEWGLDANFRAVTFDTTYTAGKPALVSDSHGQFTISFWARLNVSNDRIGSLFSTTTNGSVQDNGIRFEGQGIQIARDLESDTYNIARLGTSPNNADYNTYLINDNNWHFYSLCYSVEESLAGGVKYEWVYRVHRDGYLWSEDSVTPMNINQRTKEQQIIHKFVPFTVGGEHALITNNSDAGTGAMNNWAMTDLKIIPGQALYNNQQYTPPTRTLVGLASAEPASMTLDMPTRFDIVVESSGSASYLMQGTNRNNNLHTQQGNPTLKFRVGDEVRFRMLGVTSSHPFYIKTVATTGTGNVATGVVGNGSTTGTIVWTPESTGTYYYICSNHGAMSGTIIVEAQEVIVDVEDPTYTATPTSYTVNEGTALTINVLTTNVADGTSLYWTVTSPTEFSTTSGSFSITSNSGQFTVFPIIDGQNEGAEYFQVQIRTVSTSGTVVETTSQITINNVNVSANIVSVSTMNLPSGFYRTSSPIKFSNLSFGANGSQSSGPQYSLQSQYGQQTQITVEMWVNPVVRGDTIFGVSDPANSMYHGVDYMTNGACQWRYRAASGSPSGSIGSSAGILAQNAWGLITVELSTSSNGSMVARWWLNATGNGATYTWQNNAPGHISSFGAITFAWWPFNTNRFNGAFGPVRVSKGLIYNGSPTVPTTTFQTTADTLLIIQ